MKIERVNLYIDALRFEGIVLEDSNTALIQYSISSSSYDVKAPSIILRKIGEVWMVDAFADVFLSKCGDNICESYEIYNRYKKHMIGQLNPGECPIDCPIDCPVKCQEGYETYIYVYDDSKE